MTKQTSTTPVSDGNTTAANGTSPFSFALHSPAGESTGADSEPAWGAAGFQSMARTVTAPNAMASAAAVLGVIALAAVVISGRRRSRR
ncbi:hypothetical protein BH11PSE13_BH11PSE13_42310 [soil metagenome]